MHVCTKHEKQSLCWGDGTESCHSQWPCPWSLPGTDCVQLCTLSFTLQAVLAQQPVPWAGWMGNQPQRDPTAPGVCHWGLCQPSCAQGTWGGWCPGTPSATVGTAELSQGPQGSPVHWNWAKLIILEYLRCSQCPGIGRH